MGGIALAALFYLVPSGIPDALAASMKGVYTLIYNKYFVEGETQISQLDDYTSHNTRRLDLPHDPGPVVGLAVVAVTVDGHEHRRLDLGEPVDDARRPEVG